VETRRISPKDFAFTLSRRKLSVALTFKTPWLGVRVTYQHGHHAMAKTIALCSALGAFAVALVTVMQSSVAPTLYHLFQTWSVLSGK